MRKATSRALLFIVAGVLVTTSVVCAQGVITTIAGSEWIFRGDGGPATNAPLGQIAGLTVDSRGNLFVSDTNNHLVAKVAPSGALTVVAGNGLLGFSGENGPATSASLNTPWGAAVDQQGNVYIPDKKNHRVRKVDTSGRITTIVGTSQPGFCCDNGPATQANLLEPSAVAVDAAGNLYISDTGNNRVRKVSGGIITTVAGNGKSEFSGDGGAATAAGVYGPFGLAVDAGGNLYIADWGNRRVRKVTPGGTISTVAGEGVAGVSLNTPLGVAVDAAGNVYVADTSANTVLKVTGGVVSTAAGKGTRGYSADGTPATNALLSAPAGLAIDSAGVLYIGEMLNYRVRKVTTAGTLATVAGNGGYKSTGDGGPAIAASLNTPTSIALDSSGNLYILDSYNFRVRKVSAAGVITTVAGSGIPAFAGDGGPATMASLYLTYMEGAWMGGLAVDAAGNLYISDRNNYRVRKVTPGGIITTVAGNGVYGFSGDGGPATAAELSIPRGLTLDSGGNLYIVDSSRIRKVTPGGIITTIAGDGQEKSSGDGGAATLASLSMPMSLATGPGGELYVTEYMWGVRKIGTDGRISTVAGGGTNWPGDNGPATAAWLRAVQDVKVDAAGNLYISTDGFPGYTGCGPIGVDGLRCWSDNHIQRVGADGIIKTIAGTSPAFVGDGSPATLVALGQVAGLALDSAGNMYLAETKTDRVRKISASPPSLSVSPASLAFTATASAAGAATKLATITSSLPGVAWQASSNAAWLKISQGNGFAPASIFVSVDASVLSAATYQGAIGISATGTVPQTVTIGVTLTVSAAQPASLSVQPGSLTFQVASGGAAPSPQSLRIENTGGGALAWTARVSASEGNWLSLTPGSGTASATAPGSISVGVNPAGLAAGSYSGTIVVSAAQTNQSALVPVTLVVSPAEGALLLSQVAMAFRAVQGGGAEPPQTFGVLNVGSGSIDWSAQTTTSWLRLSPAAGRSDAASNSVPLVTVSVDATGLSAGFYTGLIRVISAGANNSPQAIRVDLQVLAAGTRLGAFVRPTGLIFVAAAGGTPPSSQEIGVTTTETAPIEFTSAPIDGNWMTRAPDVGTASSTARGRIVVQPISGLAAGIYRAGLTVMTRNDGELYPVRLLFLVLPAGTPVAPAMIAVDEPEDLLFRAASRIDRPEADASCTPSKLLLQFATVFNNFNATAGWPNVIQVNARDDCGNPAVGGNVVVSFSSGDPAVVLADLKNGVYQGSWRPGSDKQPQVLVTARATWRNLQGEVQANAQVGVNPNMQGALLNQGGVLLGAGFQRGPVAPGSIVSLFGERFTPNASISYAASVLPLPTALGTVRVLIGDKAASLFYVGQGQVNAQVPAELPAARQLQVLVETGGVPSTPEPLLTATSSPGIFTLGPQFGAQGAILISNTDALAAREGSVPGRNARPVERGGYISIYCTGLGATSPAVASGRPGPSTPPLAEVKTPVTVLVDGQSARIAYAGMAPGFVAVYQVDVQVPAGVTPGNEVPVTITQGGARSNTATIAVR